MNLVGRRLVVASALAGVVCLALAPRPSAGPVEPRFERLIARAIDPTDPKGGSLPIEIDIERWSTDKEVESLHATMLRGNQAELIHALQKTRPRVGVLRFSGIQTSGDRARTRRALIVQFARDVKTPTGRRVFVALGGERPPLGEHVGLQELRATTEPAQDVTLIEFRFTTDGQAVGKVASAGKIGYDAKTKTFVVTNHDKAPIRLTDVRAEGFNGGFARQVAK